MKTLRNIVPAVLVLGTVCCGATTRAGGYRLAAATTQTQTDVGTPYQGRSGGTESLACAGVSDAERTNPLQRTKVIFVEELRDESQKGHPTPLQGATVYMLAAPDLTKEWLGHILECHMALPPVSTAPDPLTVGDSTVEVSSTRNGYSVRIRSIDGDKARRILNSALALLK